MGLACSKRSFGTRGQPKVAEDTESSLSDSEAWEIIEDETSQPTGVAQRTQTLALITAVYDLPRPVRDLVDRFGRPSDS